MGWITLAQAQTGASATGNTNSAAKLVAAWLDTNNAKIIKNHRHRFDIVLSRAGISCVQEIIEESAEYRGLTKELAEWLSLWIAEDNTSIYDMFGETSDGEVLTCQCRYATEKYYVRERLVYKPGGTGTTTYTASPIYRPTPTLYNSAGLTTNVGRVVTADASRSNNADGWCVSTATTLYPCPDYASYIRNMNLAFVPAPTLSASNGIIVSKSAQKTCIDYVTPIYQNIRTTVKEYRYLTQSEADTKVSNEYSQQSRAIDVQVTHYGVSKIVTVRGGGIEGSAQATDKIAVSRPQGDGYYTVTVTECTYWGSSS